MNHLVPNRGLGQEGVAEEPTARPNDMARGLVLKRKRTEELTTEWTDGLTIEQTTSLSKKRTVSPGREETDESLGNGLEGTSEGSVQLESKAPSIASGNEELHPAVDNCTKGAAAPPKVPDGETAPPKVPDGEAAQEPPMDWLEPLEDDDDIDDDEQEYGGQNWELDLLPRQRWVNEQLEGEEESLARERVRSGRNSRGSKSGQVVHRRRRPQSVVDEDWEDWPTLGEGWKRKEVFRRSGFSVGNSDTYYMSPQGDRLRSKIELTRYLAGVMDISTFDFKSGMFLDHEPLRKRRKRRKFRKMSGSVGKRRTSPDVSSSPCRPRMMQQKRTPPPQPPTG